MNKPHYSAFQAASDARLKELQLLLETDNAYAFAANGASAELSKEALQVLIRPSQSVFVPIGGAPGQTIAERCEHIGADVITLTIKGEFGFDAELIALELRKRRPSFIVIAHGESPDGQSNPLEAIGTICRELDILLVVDASAALGNAAVQMDKWQVDAAIGCICECPSSTSSLTFLVYNERVFAGLEARRSCMDVRGGDQTHIQHVKGGRHYG